MLFGKIYDLRPLSRAARRDASETTTEPRSREVSPSEGMLSGGPLKLRKFEFRGTKVVNEVCRHALDWSVLTSLTLIGTPFLNPLWTTLRNEFGPTVTPSAEGTRPSGSRRKYHLVLKDIRTDFACLSLLKFVKTSLAPNTLASLFLHRLTQGRESTAELNRELYSALIYHSDSLQKLYLEGGYRRKPNFDFPQYFPLEFELLSYLTSDNMANLRELSIALDNDNWVHFPSPTTRCHALFCA